MTTRKYTKHLLKPFKVKCEKGRPVFIFHIKHQYPDGGHVVLYGYFNRKGDIVLSDGGAVVLMTKFKLQVQNVRRKGFDYKNGCISKTIPSSRWEESTHFLPFLNTMAVKLIAIVSEQEGEND